MWYAAGRKYESEKTRDMGDAGGMTGAVTLATPDVALGMRAICSLGTALFHREISSRAGALAPISTRSL